MIERILLKSIIGGEYVLGCCRFAAVAAPPFQRRVVEIVFKISKRSSCSLINDHQQYRNVTRSALDRLLGL